MNACMSEFRIVNPTLRTFSALRRASPTRASGSII